MRLHFPLSEPFAAGAYPKTDPYDLSDPEPADWRMKILAESATQFFVHAVCPGWLSAVPPWELLEDEVAPLVKANQVRPDALTLYLQPNSVFAPQSSPSLPFLFQNALEQAGLGKRVRCYVYYNLDPDAPLFGAQVETQLAAHKPFKDHNINSAADRREMFAEGNGVVWVNGGDALAQASAQNASAAGRYLAGFGVLTDTGLVDPVFFFEKMLAYLHDPSKLNAFKNLFGTSWPFLAPSPTPVPAATAAAINAAQQRLYPAPALYEAKQRLSLTDLQWRVVGNAQKALYWTRLLKSSGNANAGPPFVFNTDDMCNPFQLEAVAEFFVEWGEPSGPPLNQPLPAALPSPPHVDLQDDTWNLVFIDPFHHPTLGNPTPPKPEYFCRQYNAPNSPRCYTSNPLPSPFNADTYDAVLFLVHHGEVKAWYRWTTYTSHQWEGLAVGNCKLASSVMGNQIYYFRSITATGKNSDGSINWARKKYINYAFILSDISVGWYVPGRYYFRPGTPLDDGTAPHDAEAKKSGVIIHLGETAASDSYHANTFYSGSGGCLVSPSFPKLRRTMIELFWEDELKKPPASRETGPLFLRGRSNKACRTVITGETRTAQGTPYDANDWNDKIKGRCYVIRPDEPSQR